MFCFVHAFFEHLVHRRQRRLSLRALRALGDRELDDIGIQRADILRHVDATLSPPRPPRPQARRVVADTARPPGLS